MRSFLAGLLFLASLTPVQAAVCDYRLSVLFGSKSGTLARVAPVAGEAALAVGALYFFPQGAAGDLLMGAGASGAKTAGTVAIIANSGLSATLMSVLTAPLTLTIAGVSTLAMGATEAGCYFADERITEEAEVLAILRHTAAQSDEDVFKLFEVSPEQALQDGTASRVRIPDANGHPQFYPVSKLYIVNGALMHRDFGRNTNLGSIVMAVVPVE